MKKEIVDIISVLDDAVKDPVEGQVLLVDLQLGVAGLHQIVQTFPFYF